MTGTAPKRRLGGAIGLSALWSAACRERDEWAERSRHEYGKLAPLYTFGNLADRSSVVARDCQA